MSSKTHLPGPGTCVRRRSSPRVIFLSGWTAALSCIAFWMMSFATAFAANPFLHPLFTHNMVLQRDTTATVWGWSTPGAVVNVSINGKSASGTANAAGLWVANLPSSPAGGPHTLTITGPQSVTLNNVMFGDVWLFAGQSNMDYSVTNLNGPNLAAEIADSANYPQLRSYRVPNNLSPAPLETYNATNWIGASPSTTGGFSGTAYFTARELTKRLGNVPVGMLTSAWSGTEIKAWLTPAVALGEPDLDQELFDQELLTSITDNRAPTSIHNAKIAPLGRFKIKGVVWYQGESNVNWPEQYGRYLSGLRSGFRATFGQPNLPFIVIQLPDFGNPVSNNLQSGWAELREAQLKSVLEDSQSRIVTTIDLSGDGDLHPRNKQDVGWRASLAAAHLGNGQSLVHQGPIFTGATVSGSQIICSFSNTGAGLMIGAKTPLQPVQETPGAALSGFLIAGANKSFQPAVATVLSNNTVAVSSPSVPAPLYVRYGWNNRPFCNLYNKITDGSGNVIDGLPASPFRNDPVSRLNVNNGTGTATDAPGAVKPVVASPSTGLAFSHWSGDTHFLASSTAASTQATLGQSYVAVRANYLLTAPPTGLAAVALNAQVRLTWKAVLGVHYEIWRSNSSGGSYVKLTPQRVNMDSFVDAGLTNGTTYFYKISAVNPLGGSGLSAAVSATPLASYGPPSVAAAETKLTAPVADSLPVFAPLVDYNVTEADVAGKQLPFFTPFDSTQPAWWDNLVSELLQSRAPYVLFPTQGFTGATVGNNNDPRQLADLVDALQRAGANDGTIKFGCYVDTPRGRDIYNTLRGFTAGTPMNLAVTTTTDYADVFWQRMIKPWFDEIPSTLWYRVGNRPLIHLSAMGAPEFANTSGNARHILTYLESAFQSAYGIAPFFALDTSWQTADPGSINVGSVLLVNPRFAPPSTAFQYLTAKGQTGGIAVPGFIDPANPTVQISRRNVSGTGNPGDTLRAGLNAGVTANARDTILEGWNNVTEGTGFYRSLDAAWNGPNRYIDLVRAFSDLRTVTLRLEAEACDNFANSTSGNSGGAYRRSGNLDVRALPGSGWAVTNTKANESIQFDGFQFSAGNYRVYLRYSSTAVSKVRLVVDNAPLPEVMLPSTGGVSQWGTLLIGSRALSHGTHSLRLLFTEVNGALDVDWLFVKKYDPMMNFRSVSNSLFLCAESGGNSTLVCNRTYAGSFENFSVNSLNGGGVVGHGDAVSIQVKNGLYLNAAGGGGAGMECNRRSAGSHEMFTIVKVTGSGPIANGDEVAIRTVNGRYLTVAGPTTVNATATTIGTEQKFIVNLTNQ